MEDPSPHPTHTCKDGRRGDGVGRNTDSRGPTSQEMKDRPDQSKVDKRGEK
jgi:hypothetical protein